MFAKLNTTTATAQDQLIWKILFDRQTALLHRRAAPAFTQGLARLGMRREVIPDIGELSATVFEQTGWKLAPVGRPFEPAAFFEPAGRAPVPDCDPHPAHARVRFQSSA
ncbi:hypothetical protein ACFQT0_18625 [Hymenobacter humi]|uniref:Biopterin-dependent aromatic amino acid hydroxylase family profile domain-containing protein n=1 Tax=Hymenobacter humi TaxID=1411620 RepID=A0ABW2U6S5_9BACT